MSDDTTRLVQFLRDRFDEDEQAARRVADGWTDADFELTFPDMTASTRAQVVRHGPARVLRETEIDRELLAEYERLLTAHDAHQREAARLAEQGDDDPIRHAALRREADYLPAMLHVLEGWARRKAVVYADCPGYRAEWRP